MVKKAAVILVALGMVGAVRAHAQEFGRVAIFW